MSERDLINSTSSGVGKNIGKSKTGERIDFGFGCTPQTTHKTTSHARSQCPEICSFGPHRSFLPAMPMKCFALLTRSGE